MAIFFLSLFPGHITVVEQSTYNNMYLICCLVQGPAEQAEARLQLALKAAGNNSVI